MFGMNKEFDSQVLMTTMMGSVVAVFNSACSEKNTDGPTTATRKIGRTENGKMDVNIDLHYKSYSKCCISAINFFIDMKSQEKNNTCGFIILYVKESCLIELLRAMGFPPVARKKESELLDCCGEVCNMIAGEFKNQLAKTGYTDLFMSVPQTHMRSFHEGVNCPLCVKYYQELSFYYFNTKAVTVDVAMANISHS